MNFNAGAQGQTEIAKARPSFEILNSGLRFDHFVGPFTVWNNTHPVAKDFALVADALDAAILRFRVTGYRYDVIDSQGELVYSFER